MKRQIIWVASVVFGLQGGLVPAAGYGNDDGDGRAFATATVARYSGHTNQAGLHLPPWDRVEIWGVAFKDKPAIGAPVTVIPFAAAVPPMTLSVASVAGGESCAGEEPPWLVGLEPVTRTDFFDAAPVAADRAAAYPFDVAVVYPAAESAAYLAPADIDEAAMPDDFGRSHIHGAVDLSGDRRADVLFIKYCTKRLERDQPYTQCDYVSTRTYHRTSGGWRVVDETQPC
jgi:hypothetical protein